MKFLKLKLHHLSNYLINLYDDMGINLQFVMYNYNDTSDNKKFKVSTIIELDITSNKIIRTTSFTTCSDEKTDGVTAIEPCTQECYDRLWTSLSASIDQVLKINKELKKLKDLKKNVGRHQLTYEGKQRLKREKKQLENNRSIVKSNLKTMLKELFEGERELIEVVSV